MATIHFTSGKTQEIDTDRFEKFIPELKSRGIRLMLDTNDERSLLIPLNSNTIEFIEKKFEKVEKPEPVEEKPVSDIEALENMKKEIEESKKEVESKKDLEERQKEAMDELMAKSNCTHTNQSIRVQQTSNGPRYFPACDFCGKRERFVKADSLTDEQKENAILWED